MGAERRAALAVELSKQAAQTALSGIRARDPKLSEDEARRRLFREVLGDALYTAAFEPTRKC
jgi:hypothetical protein